MPRLEASVDTRLEASTSLDQAASCRTSYGAIVTGRAPPATFFLQVCSKRSWGVRPFSFLACWRCAGARQGGRGEDGMPPPKKIPKFFLDFPSRLEQKS